MFIQLFSWPTCILTQSGTIFATYRFMHFVVPAIIHVINALQIKKLFGKKMEFATILLCTSTAGLMLECFIRFFTHNPSKDSDQKANEIQVHSPNESNDEGKHKRNKSKSHSLIDPTEVNGKEDTKATIIALPKTNTTNTHETNIDVDDTIGIPAHTNINIEAPTKTEVTGLTRNMKTAQIQLIIMSPNQLTSI